MGLYTTALIKVLRTISENGTNGRSLCMIGRQDILIEWESFGKILDNMQFSYDREIYGQIKNKYPINSYLFFKMFGFKEVHAVDYSNHDGADIILDLNTDLPENLCEQYDYIINGGTLEHIFDVAKAMKNISDMVKVGGIVIHILPLSGYVNHGFYSFSPTFLLDFYRLNDFYIYHIDMEFMIGSFDSYRGNYKNFQAVYSQDCRLFENNADDWAQSELNKYINNINEINGIFHAYLWCIAKRRISKTFEYPIQGMYKKLVDQSKDE